MFAVSPEEFTRFKKEITCSELEENGKFYPLSTENFIEFLAQMEQGTTEKLIEIVKKNVDNGCELSYFLMREAEKYFYPAAEAEADIVVRNSVRILDDHEDSAGFF